MKENKKLFVIFCAIILLICVGIVKTSNKFKSTLTDDGFTLVYENEGGNFYLYRENHTDVMYVLYRDKVLYAGMGGLTVMLAPDGTPLLYSEWVEMEKAGDNSNGAEN